MSRCIFDFPSVDSVHTHDYMRYILAEGGIIIHIVLGPRVYKFYGESDKVTSYWFSAMMHATKN